MAWYGKGFNDGNDSETPRFIPAGKEPVDFIPVGKEDNYVQDSQGDWWESDDWDDMMV